MSSPPLSVRAPRTRLVRASGLVGVGLLGVACGTTSPSGVDASRRCDGVELLVAGSDYTSSVVCGAPVCELVPGRTTGLDLGSGPQLATSNGRAFFLAWPMDFIFEIDPRCGTITSRLDVKDVAKQAGSLGVANPHDVAAAPDGSLWIAMYNVPYVAIVKEGRALETIDLSSYDPEDGNPQAESVRILDVGGVPKAFVALERLDDRDKLRSSRPSFVLRIDVATRAVEQVIELEGRNPFNPMSELGAALFLAEPGNFDAADEPLAGVERVDTTGGTAKLLVRERDLGGSVSTVAVTEGCGAAIVAGPQKDVNPTALVTFDPATGRVFTTAAAPLLGPTSGYDLQGLAWRGGALYVGDRRAGAGGYPVHVFERTASSGCDLRETSRTLVLPLPPVALRPALESGAVGGR